jgi:hypothetical protein
VAGLSVAAVLRYVLGSIEQNFWGVAAGLTLGILAALRTTERTSLKLR